MVYVFRRFRVEHTDPVGLNVQLWTDLPGVGLTLRQTLTFPPTAIRRAQFLTFNSQWKAHSFSVRIVPASVCLLYEAAIEMKVLGGDAPWQWYPLPVAQTGDAGAWVTLPLNIPKTPNDWSSLPLQIPATPEDWSSLPLQIPATPDEWGRFPIVAAASPIWRWVEMPHGDS